MVADETEFKTDLVSLGLADWGEEVAVGIFAPGPVKYAMGEELSADTLRDFVEAFLEESLPPFLSSESPPRTDKTAALVRKIVGSTFERVVQSPDQAVVVRVCIPELPDCQKSNDWYDKAAARYYGNNGVIFGDFNVALNDLPLGTSIDADLPVFLYSARGKTNLVTVSPKPTDDADLVFFLKFRQQLPPLREEGADWRTAELGGKKSGKKDSSKKNKDAKKTDSKKKDSNKKGKKDKAKKDKSKKGKDEL